MSQWKWQSLFQLSQIHGVTPWVADGIRNLHDDFFLQLSDELRGKFLADTTSRTNVREHISLTNPLLDRRLQELYDEAGSEDATFNLLQDILSLSNNIISRGVNLRQLIWLGQGQRSNDHAVMYDVLSNWIVRLHLQRMVQLEAALLIELFHFKPEEIRFTDTIPAGNTESVVQDIFHKTQQNAAEWYFTQGESIFVRANNSNSMLWHMRQPIKYLRYYPSEAVTSFFANFTHSLTHIEE